MPEDDLINGQMRLILDSMAEGVIALDAEGKLIFVNKAVSGFFGIEEDKAAGISAIEIIRNHDLDKFLKNVLDTQRAAETEIAMVTPVESVFKVRANVFGNDASVKRGIIAVLQDITELRNLERVRSEFASNVSHELKTPLASIKGYVETLQDGAIDDKKNNMNFLKIINGQVERLDRLISDILELSKIESGRAELTPVEFELKEVFKSVEDIIKPSADKKKIKIRASLPEEFGKIRADKNKIEIALLNLADNAVKYTGDKGNVTLTAERKEGKVRISVSDSGPGIPAEFLPRIFERFFRVDNARAREFGGTGLGLSIVKHVMEAHRGSVLVESEVGIGSKFTLTLPE